MTSSPRGGRRPRRSPSTHLFLCSVRTCDRPATRVAIVGDAGHVSIMLRCDECAKELQDFYDKYLPNYSITVKRLM